MHDFSSWKRLQRFYETFLKSRKCKVLVVREFLSETPFSNLNIFWSYIFHMKYISNQIWWIAFNFGFCIKSSQSKRTTNIIKYRSEPKAIKEQNLRVLTQKTVVFFLMNSIDYLSHKSLPNIYICWINLFVCFL